MLLLRGEGDALRDVIPLLEAVAATAGGGVLRHKDGVSAHRGLLAVVWDHGGRKALAHKVGGVLTEKIFTELFGVGFVL